MSRINNNSMQRRWGPPVPPPQGFWWFEEGTLAQGSFTSYPNRMQGSGSLREPWGRIVAGPLSGFPSYLLPILDEVMPSGSIFSPTLSTPAPTLEFDRDGSDSPKLPEDEQNKMLKKLRREIFNPAPKRLTKRVGQYYKDGVFKSSFDSKVKQYDGDEDEKRCAICLDDFEAKQVVTVTPCDHMFHEDCIVPWVKSHRHCPICRFSI